MTDQSNSGNGSRRTYSAFRRRGFLQKTGGLASAGILAGIAGCTGNENNATPSDGGSGGTAGSSGGGGNGNSKLTWWNYSGTQSDTAKAEVNDRLKNFQSDTGTSVDMSIYGYGDVTGQKWATLFEQERYPPIFDNFSPYTGRFIPYLKPVKEYRDWFSDEALSKFEWLQPTLEQKYSGFDGVYEIPYGIKGRMNILVRMDHWKEAGLDPSEFPPDSIDDLIEKAQILQENGPGDYGYHIVGGKFDLLDSDLPAWTVAQGGQDGLFLTEDLKDTRMDNQVWKDVFTKYVNIYQKHGLSSDGSVSRNDEDNLRRMIQGSVSMATIGMDNWPIALDTASDLIESGKLQWGTLWGGGEISFYSFYLTKPPSDVDAAVWEKKQKAAVKLIEDYWLNTESQKENMNKLGVMPIEKNVWDTLQETKANEITAQRQLLNKSEYAWQNHAQLPNIMFNVAPPHLHKAYKGNLSPEEAVEEAAKAVRQVL